MHIVCTPPPPTLYSLGGGGVEPLTKFSEREQFDKTSTFRGGFLGNRRVTFFSGGGNFYIKNKLKYEIFNDK